MWDMAPKAPLLTGIHPYEIQSEVFDALHRFEYASKISPCITSNNEPANRIMDLQTSGAGTSKTFFSGPDANKCHKHRITRALSAT
jgi:hypothetical protein